jgi:putative nucleotidyltransferase with HDIG domain
MLWEHNLRTAIAAKAVARLAKQEISPDVAFTGGILHDIGKTVISDFLKDTAAEVVHELDEGKLPDYLAGEEEKLGVNHCMVGEELARAWKIPSPFPEIIRYHHRPQEAPAQCRGEVYAVHVGDILAMMEGTGTGSDAMCYQLDSRIGEVFTLGADTLALVLSGVEDEFSRTKALLFGGKGQ